MVSISFSIRAGGLALGLACLVAGAVEAADSVGLAPPGPCAEPREAISGVSVSQISVVGPLQAFFGPADVAAAPASPARPAPSPVASARPVACDQPGANCALTPAFEFSAPPIIPGERPSPAGPSKKPQPMEPPQPGGGKPSTEGMSPIAPGKRPPGGAYAGKPGND